jgi:hypothetical protein
MTIETYDTIGLPDIFCEALVRIDRIGSCRRLVLVVTDHSDPGFTRAVVAKIVIPAEALPDIVAMLSADRPDLISAFARLTDYVVAN